MLELYAYGFSTLGGKYTAMEFDGYYYEVKLDRIVLTDKLLAEKYGSIPTEKTVYEFPCRVKSLMSWPGRTIGHYDVYLKDNRYMKITITPGGVLGASYLDYPECIKYPWYGTIGAMIEYFGDRAFIGDREVSIKKNTISGWYFCLERDKFKINAEEYIVSFTHPIPVDAIEKLKGGKKPIPQEIFPGLPGNTKSVTVKGSNILAEIPGRFVPFRAGLQYTENGIVYTNVIFREGVADVLIHPYDDVAITDTIDDVPDENIVDFYEVPIVVDVLPEKFEKLPGGDFLIIYNNFEIRTNGEETFICKNGACTKVDISGLPVSQIVRMYYYLI